MAGQQSLNCQTTVPMQYGRSERKCSMPKASARAWFSCVR
jgi:hypothetical protein